MRWVSRTALSNAVTFVAAFPSKAWSTAAVDGAYHAARRAADARRDCELGRCGWRVLRLPAELVAKDRAEAVALVREALGSG